MRIDIIIPNYNGSHLYQKNLSYVIDAIKAYDGRIIIVDDGSERDDVKKLQKVIDYQNSDIIDLIIHNKNLGFSSAINSGVKKSAAKYIVLLNSDVRPKKNFLEVLIRRMENDKNLFGLGCLDESIEGGKIVKRGRGIGYWKKGMIMHKRGEVNQDDTFWISGGSCIIRRDLFNEIGGMDSLYNPFYWEDIDLSYRAVKSGYSIGFEKTSVVEHYHDEGAIKSFKEDSVRPIAYRNQFIFIWKNITSVKLLLSHIGFMPYHLTNALLRKDKAFIEGLFLALAKLPDIISKRKLQKKKYKISDLAILSKIS